MLPDLGDVVFNRFDVIVGDVVLKRRVFYGLRVLVEFKCVPGVDHESVSGVHVELRGGLHARHAASVCGVRGWVGRFGVGW